MFNEEILTCLEQKKILLTQILNLTKQIEVRCNEPEVELEHFLDQRGALMKRVDMCNNLIDSKIVQMPPEQQSRAAFILNGTSDENDCNPEELSVLQLVNQCDTLFHRAAALDQSANDAIKRQHSEVKEKLKQLRKFGKGQDMFQNF